MKSRWTLLGSILAVLLLALAAGLTRAQGPEPPGEGVQPQDVGVQAAVGAVIPIQGRLTDASGNPVPDGNYSITARIYNVSSGGTALCSDTDTVPVSNGLFNMYIDNCTSAILNGQQLYLGVQVGSDAEMTPRQAIYPAPYAWSLRPGAVISDSASIHTLVLTNNGPDSNNHALHAYSKSSNAVFAYTRSPYAAISGENYGTSGDRIGVYGYSETGIAIKAAGTGIIQSTAVSRVFVPGGEAVVGGTATSDVQLTYWGQGRVDVKTTSNNVTRTLVIPLPLPAVLYGQQVRIADIRVYYRTSNSASYIAETDVYREQIGGTYYALIENTTHRTSTTDTYYHLSCTDANCRLSDDEGFVSVRLQLYFNSNAHTITIGGVRVTLEHD